MRFLDAARFIGTFAVVAAAAAAPLAASTGADPNPEDQTPIRVVNNHLERVAVYVVTSDARRLYVGTVNRTRFKEFELPSELVQGGFQVQVLPRSNPAGLGPWSETAAGIQTRPVQIGAGHAIHVFVEPELDRSIVEVAVG